MVVRVPAFQPGGPGSIPGGVRNFNFCPGVGCVSFVCVVFGGGPEIVLNTYSGRPAHVYLSSVLVQRLLLPLQASDPRAFGLSVLGCVSPRLGEGNKRRRRRTLIISISYYLQIIKIIAYPQQFISNFYTEEISKYNLSYYEMIKSFVF